MTAQGYSVTRWERDRDTGLQLHEVFMEAMPKGSQSDPEQALMAYHKLTERYPSSTWVARRGERVLGLVMLMQGPSPQLARVIGAVRPSDRRVGIGRSLWSKLLGNLDTHPALTQLQTRTFGSFVHSQRFVERLGFREVERMRWLERELSAPLSVELETRLTRLSEGSVRVLSAIDYQRLRPDWERAWWELEREAQRDIPSALGVIQPTFKEWCDVVGTPLRPHERALIAVDGAEPVGVLLFGDNRGGVVNIDYTVVAASHRRRGVSLALKARAIEAARELGGLKVSTQNHAQNEPIIKANLCFGFYESDCLIDYVYELS